MNNLSSDKIKKSGATNSLKPLTVNKWCLPTGKNKLCIHSLVVAKWLYSIYFYTVEFELFEQECIDLNHRGKCLNKGIKLKWGFAKMSGASKEWFFDSDSFISRHIFSFDCWECMYYILLIVFLYCNFNFVLSKNVSQSIECDTLICSLLFALKFLKRLVLFGNRSLQGLLPYLDHVHFVAFQT